MGGALVGGALVGDASDSGALEVDDPVVQWGNLQEPFPSL